MDKDSKAFNFFSNPIVGVLGSIASLLGLILAVFFYFSAEKSPELVYSIHPTKSVLVAKDISSDISVFYKDEAITDSDIVAVSLSIWNDGNSSIRTSSILEPILINLGHDVRILEATVTKASRTVTGIEISDEDEMFKKGNVSLSWKILEGGDGGNIQIIYAGSKDAELKITGIIEEQGEPVKLSTLSMEPSKLSPFTEIKLIKWLVPFILLSSVFFAVLIIRFPAFSKYLPPPFKRLTREAMPLTPLIVACTPFVIGAIYIFVKLDAWYPPFGF